MNILMFLLFHSVVGLTFNHAEVYISAFTFRGPWVVSSFHKQHCNEHSRTRLLEHMQELSANRTA